MIYSITSHKSIVSNMSKALYRAEQVMCFGEGKAAVVDASPFSCDPPSLHSAFDQAARESASVLSSTWESPCQTRSVASSSRQAMCLRPR